MLQCQILLSDMDSFRSKNQIGSIENIEKIILELKTGQITVLPQHCDLLSIVHECIFFKRRAKKLSDNLSISHSTEYGADQKFSLLNEAESNGKIYPHPDLNDYDLIEFKLKLTDGTFMIKNNLAYIICKSIAS